MGSINESASFKARSASEKARSAGESDSRSSDMGGMDEEGATAATVLEADGDGIEDSCATSGDASASFVACASISTAAVNGFSS